MAKNKIVNLTPDVPAPVEDVPDNSDFVIAAPPEQISEAPLPEVIPADPDEQPANHFGVWPTAYGQRVQGIGFDGVGTITQYGETTCEVTADVDGETYFVARAELGVVEG